MSRYDIEAEVYMKHGADEQLAKAMADAFNTTSWGPWEPLSKRVENAYTDTQLTYISLAYIVQGKKEMARFYMEQAAEKCPSFTRHKTEYLINNFDKIYDVLEASKAEINKLRKTLYKMPTVLEDHLK